MALAHKTLSHCAKEVHEVSTNRFISVKLTERTQNCIRLYYKENNLKNEHARVFYGVLVYEFKRIVGKPNFSDQFKKIIKPNKRVGYNMDIMHSLHARL